MQPKDEIRHSRRKLLKLGFFTLCAFATPAELFAALTSKSYPERSLAFFNTHTCERLQATYWANGEYQTSALEKINFILRDHRSGEIASIHPQLLDVLYCVQNRISLWEPIHIISGYRSPETNERLRRKSSGVVQRSYHIKGQAVDFRLPGCSLSSLRRVALDLKAGGVGYYPKSGFVHLDIGPVRWW